MNNLRFTKAPKPPTPIRKISAVLISEPGPIETPLDFPPHYPGTLRVKTESAIVSAVKGFPRRSILEACKRVLAKLTSAYCDEVKAARLRPDLALSHMADLLHSLLVCNVSIPSEGYRLEQELRRSKEWISFIRRLQKARKKDYGHLLSKLGAEREELNRRLERPARYGRNPHRPLIERKLVVEKEIAHLEMLQGKLESASQKTGPTPGAKQIAPPLSWEDVKERPSLSQKEAARLLACSDRQVRTYISRSKLTRSAARRVVNDQKLKALYDAKHRAIKYL